MRAQVTEMNPTSGKAVFPLSDSLFVLTVFLCRDSEN